MKKLIVYFVTALGLMSAAQAAEAPRIEGWSLGVTSTEILSQDYAGLRVGWWHKYFGADLSWWSGAWQLETEGEKFLDVTSGWFGIGIKGGYQFNRLKPFARAGFAGSVSDNKLADVEVTTGLFQMTLGIDFAVVENLDLGINLLDYKYITNGDVNSDNTNSEIEGSTATIFRGFHIGYRF